MHRSLLLTSLLLAAPIAAAQEAPPDDAKDAEDAEDAEDEDASEFSYVTDAKERPWKDIYRQGHSSGLGGSIGAGVGLAAVGVGVALAGPNGCAPVDGVCTNSWIGDGFMTFGALVGHASVIAQNVGSLKARKALKQSGVAQVSALPGTFGVVLWLGAMGSAVGWFGVAKPTDALPPFPYVGSRQFLIADHVLLAAAWGLGIAQHSMISKYRDQMLPELDTARVDWDVSPELGAEYAGLRLSATW